MKRSRLITLGIVAMGAGLALLAGCGGETAAEPWKLNHLVILGAVANPPAFQNPAAGTVNVQLDPFISDINGNGSVTMLVQSCLDPGEQNGVVDDCSKVAGASAVQSVVIPAPMNMSVGVFGNPERTGKSSTGPVTVPLVIPANFLASYPAAAQFNGVAFLITMVASNATETVRASRRVFVSTQTPNLNPTLQDILANGVSLTAIPTKNVALSVLTSAPETYQVITLDGNQETRTELFDTTWYVSDGTLSNPHTQGATTSDWKVPTARPAGRDVIMVGVLREIRGGVSVLVKRF